ncbi:MAG: WxL domain-containing protein [Enterococcus casseliflavus]
MPAQNSMRRNHNGLRAEQISSRPNYVQVSDRRETDDRGGWSLLARLSDEGFRNEANEELRGASIHLANQDLVKPSANTGGTPQIVRNDGADLLPGVTTRLLDANAAEGQGTWVYRFGDQDTAGSSVKLNVPAGANPKATNYQATINWELSVVPGND